MTNEKQGHQSVDMDEFKQSAKSHPLFPLLEYLFFKCERSTSSLNDVHTKLRMEEVAAVLCKNRNTKRSDSNEDEQEEGAETIEERFVWKTGDEELDHLMLDAIRVLRVQLHELEKVDELCKDFCSRYISCLKGKVGQEMLSGWSVVGEDDSCSSPPAPSCPPDKNRVPSAILATMQTRNGPVTIPLIIPTQPFYGSTVNSPPANARSAVKRRNTCSPTPADHQGTKAIDHHGPPSLLAVGGGKEEAGRGKRCSLPRCAVDILRDWLFRNMRHPYPSEEQKRDLSARSGLNLLQVNNWFINARRRIVQPLLDGFGSSPSSARGENSASSATLPLSPVFHSLPTENW